MTPTLYFRLNPETSSVVNLMFYTGDSVNPLNEAPIHLGRFIQSSYPGLHFQINGSNHSIVPLMIRLTKDQRHREEVFERMSKSSESNDYLVAHIYVTGQFWVDWGLQSKLCHGVEERNEFEACTSHLPIQTGFYAVMTRCGPDLGVLYREPDFFSTVSLKSLTHLMRRMVTLLDALKKTSIVHSNLRLECISVGTNGLLDSVVLTDLDDAFVSNQNLPPPKPRPGLGPSPERLLENNARCDHRSDIYAMGMVFWLLIDKLLCSSTSLKEHLPTKYWMLAPLGAIHNRTVHEQRPMKTIEWVKIQSLISMYRLKWHKKLSLNEPNLSAPLRGAGRLITEVIAPMMHLHADQRPDSAMLLNRLKSIQI